MKTTFQELPQRSAFAGALKLEIVKGTTSGNLNPENDVEVKVGQDRSMYVYVPESGVYHAKQAQVLMVLRDGDDADSAQALLDGLGLAQLAEEDHFVVVFPNPLAEGWNYALDPAHDDDKQFIVRCFAALKPSESGVAGFNGMIYHLGATPAGSAMAMTLAVTSPLDAAAIVIGAFPEGYEIPSGAGAEQVAWLYEDNAAAEEYLARVDGASGNPCVRYVASDTGLTAAGMRAAWDELVCGTRRWRNDTYGIYQPRIDFAEKGVVAHVEDTSLGVNDGFAHTWYEYVPERLRGTDEPIPLVLYLHGINCVPLYGAEQSGWMDIADRDGFAVVFPAPAIEERWNVWDDPRLPSDASFLLALIEHMGNVHPIDRSRIYVSGFSMGSMMTNAMACSYPEVFAGAMALNGPHQGYLMTLDASAKGLLAFRPSSVVKDLAPSDAAVSPTHALADEKRAAFDYRMPFVQIVGLLDGVGGAGPKAWPLTPDGGGMWQGTIGYWLSFDNVPGALRVTGEGELGCDADTVEEVGRFVHLAWRSADDGAPELYHLIGVRRMPHAVDLRGVEMAWELVRGYRRLPDGTLESAC